MSTEKKISDNLAAEFAESEAVEQTPDRMVREDVKVTRGNGRSRVLQVRLNDEEYAELEALAATLGDGGVPVSTAARSLLLQALRAPVPSAAPADIARLTNALSANLKNISMQFEEATRRFGKMVPPPQVPDLFDIGEGPDRDAAHHKGAGHFS